MFFPRCASWYAFWGRRPCCMKSCTVCTGAVSPRCYFTFSLSSSSFCKNFVGNADNEHNGTIKRKGSLFFGDERKSSKPEKLKKWGWCARDFCEDALSTGERDIGAKKRQVLLDPSKKLLLPKHNMHTFKILIHSMEKKGDKYHSLVSLQPLVVPGSFFVGIVKVRQIFCLDFHGLRVESNWLMSQVYDSDSSGP